MTDIVDDFHKLYYNSGVWATSTKWMGVPVQKCPLDLWVYQEIINEVRPGLIIETGTAYGGSALFMAHVCDLIGHGYVTSIDIAKDESRPKHPRIRYWDGSSIDPRIVHAAMMNVEETSETGNPPVLVILDSDHSRDYVLKEMEVYAPLVSVGSYLIVEDTNVHGHPVCPDHGPGPFEAVAEFLKTHPEFEIDHSREKFLMTQNPSGYLRRKHGS